ncbi:hypothetical protein D9758_013278 [Tetrapyrgos nigripes]|uniref:Uncharacterized protein n=1 Tax=Tetrapyrgos nigripes TaxID=182062 RepID=A0A8H5CMC1_9AGAR|nr:hypothetical protein D9758_013278 [Tetrapyrgos nigripes]
MCKVNRPESRNFKQLAWRRRTESRQNGNFSSLHPYNKVFDRPPHSPSKTPFLGSYEYHILSSAPLSLLYRTPPPLFGSSLHIAMDSSQVITVELAYVWGIIISTFLYGVYLVLFWIAMYILLLPLTAPYDTTREPVNKILVTVSVLMCCTCTTHFVAQCIRLHKGYVQRMHPTETLYHVGSGVDGPMPYLENTNKPLAIATGVCFTVAALLTDGLTIYRLYIIWNRSFNACILPIISLIGILVCGLAVCGLAAEMAPSAPLFGSTAAEWLIATFVCGLTTNFIALASVTVRFRQNAQDKKTSRVPGATGSRNTTKMVALIMLESAAIYSGTKFINLMLLVAETNVTFAFFCICIPMTGIASHLLIIHVGYHKYFGGSGIGTGSVHRSFSSRIASGHFTSSTVGGRSTPFTHLPFSPRSSQFIRPPLSPRSSQVPPTLCLSPSDNINYKTDSIRNSIAFSPTRIRFSAGPGDGDPEDDDRESQDRLSGYKNHDRDNDTDRATVTEDDEPKTGSSSSSSHTHHGVLVPSVIIGESVTRTMTAPSDGYT